MVTPEFEAAVIGQTMQNFAIFRYLWNSEGKAFVLLRREIEDVVRIQINAEPYKYNCGKQYKARTVFHCRKKGKQKNPKDGIISYSNKGEWVSVPLFD
jgi:hypothetical protein